jgi:hypothetical protein
MMAISVSHLLTGEFFFTVTALSGSSTWPPAWSLLRAATVGSAVLLTLWLQLKALVDYTSSGRKSPQPFPIAIFLARYFERPVDTRPTGAICGFSSSCSRAFVNRPRCCCSPCRSPR